MRRRPLLRSAAVGAGAYVLGKRRQEADQRALTERRRLGDLDKLHEDDAPGAEELDARMSKL